MKRCAVSIADMDSFSVWFIFLVCIISFAGVSENVEH